MKCRSVLGLAFATSALALAATAAFAAELPAIKIANGNKVPDCATPGRMMSYIKTRNASLDPKFEKIAVHYMREGEALGVRWDYAIAQMVVETNYLTYKQGNGKPGLVNVKQNNFAGLGATGKGHPGESFADVETGVRAHLQHLLHYAGDTIPDAAAERTRKIQEWGVLKSFHAKIKGPVTFKHLANKWAMDNNYAVSIETHAQRFYSDFCKGADPQPELLAEARGGTKASKVAAVAPAKQAAPAAPAAPVAEKPVEKSVAEKPAEKITGADLAKRAIEAGKAEGTSKPQGLGVRPMTIINAPTDPDGPAKGERAEAFDPPAETNAKAEAKVEKAVAAGAAKAEAADKAVPKKGAEKQPAPFVTANAAAGALAGNLGANSKLAPSPASKCKVFTASYGGQKSIIIRAQSAGTTNYTVLDVNEGQEKREADAYIAAYAKGGEIAAEFPSQNQALDKAFELCPEG